MLERWTHPWSVVAASTVVALGCAGFGTPPRDPIALCDEGQSTSAWFSERFPRAGADEIAQWVQTDVHLPRKVYLCPTPSERTLVRWTWLHHAALHGPGVHRTDLGTYGASPDGDPSLEFLRVEYPIPGDLEPRAELVLAYDPKD